MAGDGTPDMEQVAEALKPINDPALVGRATLAWIFGASSESPGGLDAVAMIAASPATSAEHRLALVHALGHATQAVDLFLDPTRGYLADRRERGLTRAEATLLLAGLPVRDWNDRYAGGFHAMRGSHHTSSEQAVGVFGAGAGFRCDEPRS